MKALFVVGAVIICALSVAFFSSHDTENTIAVNSNLTAQNPTNSKTAAASVSKQSPQPTTREVSTTADKISTKRNPSLDSFTDQDLHPQADSSDISSNDQEDKEKIINDRRDAQLKSILIALNKNPNETLANIASSSFAAENPDYEWSFEYENKIKTFFHDTPDFANFSPDSVECRAERCKVVIAIANPDQLQSMSRTIIDNIYNNKNSLTQNASFVIDDQNNILNFYFKKTQEGNPISSNP